jgi:D-alanyl-D-alanine dipeptidase
MKDKQDFIYLKNIEPTIIESIRYSTKDNFVGQVINGYYQSQGVIVTRAAAEALKNVQETLKNFGYGLVVYDGYRPQIAVNHFIEWSHSQDQSQKELYYPTVDKSDLFSLGYIAEKSGHSRGSTVDVSIIKLCDTIHDIEVSEKILTDGSTIPFLDDGTVDMGSSFDLFHNVSHHDSHLIDQECIDRRNFLKKVMEDNGFLPYNEEWWHYTLANEPYPNTYFDFLSLE